MCLYPFAWTNVFSAKYTCFAIWARVDTKFLNSSHHVLSMDDRPGDATCFLRGQPLKIIHKYSAKKGRAAWILFLTPAPRPLEVTFLVGEAEHMWLYSFAKSCKEPYPLKQSWDIFFLGFDVHICSSELPPMKIIFLWPDVCTPQENNFKTF